MTDRGFGFIESLPLSKDLFFHHVELRDIGFDELREGDMITFLAGGGTHGLVAMEVERL
ncbi:MAG: cold shock domain-containing protein [Rhizobiaceae bacterium]|nr:cold shock domain-containing protein [Rhizobiaceae bacterium]